MEAEGGKYRTASIPLNLFSIKPLPGQTTRSMSLADATEEEEEDIPITTTYTKNQQNIFTQLVCFCFLVNGPLTYDYMLRIKYSSEPAFSGLLPTAVWTMTSPSASDLAPPYV